jgi:2-C-methyl-D-erythritol 4-phosphate cytidylyltransferase / 2-C-methyl-D-erythritol 2,4-cyclodiphosphate synthase
LHVTAIIAAGGAGRRLGGSVPKQLLEIGGRSLLERSVDAFRSHTAVADVIVALPPALVSEPPRWLEGVRLVAGGERRQDSVASAFDVIADRTEVVLVHDAARPFVSPALISRTIDAAAEHGAAIAAVDVRDTVKRAEAVAGSHVIVETIPRETIFLAQTPQGFRREVLAAAIELGRSGVDVTDEASLAGRVGYRVHVVAGEPDNVKITTVEDLAAARGRVAPARTGRVGTGYDLHRLVSGRPLVVGGVTIPVDRGPLGHSDGDVACHAVTDAVLGAACLGDIGRHFPDSDSRWKGASSLDLLRDAVAMVAAQGFEVGNVDVTVILEAPKLREHIDGMRAAMARALGIDVSRVSVKAKTNEGMDAVGRGDAIAAHATALLRAV